MAARVGPTAVVAAARAIAARHALGVGHAAKKLPLRRGSSGNSGAGCSQWWHGAPGRTATRAPTEGAAVASGLFRLGSAGCDAVR